MSHRSLVRHCARIRLGLAILGFSGALVLSGLLSVSQAQVTTNIVGDLTLGTRVNPIGNVYEITEGTRIESNLFHSFESFTVGTGDIASFAEPFGPGSGLGIMNILARVTGIDTLNAFPGSTIDGLLQSTIPGANLFLMNPRGIVFGPNAVLDIGASVGQAGSFYATTADYIRLADTVQFNAIPDLASDALLSSEPVVAFGFLGPTFAPIAVEGSFLQVPFNVDPATGASVGQTIGLIGGDITIAPDPALGTPTLLWAPSGVIKLASLASPGEVVISDPASPLLIDSMGGQGPITISGSSTLTTSDFNFQFDPSVGDGRGGTVVIRGGQLMVDNSFINSFTFGNVDGAVDGIDIQVNSATLTGGSLVEAGTIGNFVDPGALGKGGRVLVSATDTLSLSGEDAFGTPTSILSQSLGGGMSGELVITGGSLDLNGGLIEIRTFGDGGAEPLRVTVDDFTATNGGRLSTQTFSPTVAGDVFVTVTNSFALSGEGAAGNNSAIRSISSGGGGPTGNITVTAGSGTLSGGAFIGGEIGNASQSGTVDVTVTGTLTISGRDAGGIPSQILNASVSDAPSGPTNVTADTLILSDGGSILSQSFANGRGGPVNVTGTTAITMSSDSSIASIAADRLVGDVTVFTPSLFMDDSVISVRTEGAGDAGNVIARLGTLTMVNGAKFTSSSELGATGAAGSITIHGLASPADSVTLTNSSLLTSAANTGQGGSITVDATTLTLNDATISASVKDFDVADPTDGADMGLGNIALTSSTLDMTGGTITAETAGSRNAGNIAIFTTGNTLSLAAGSSITSSTTSSGNAGQIFILTPALSLDNATIATSTSSSGNAGSITAITGTLTLTNLAQIDSSSTGTVPGASGNAGQIVLLAGDSLQSNNSTVTTFVQQGPGTTGTASDITVVADSFSLNNASTLSAATAGPTNAGTINITTTGNTVSLAGGSSITSSTTGAGDAGQVVITTPSLTLNNGTISTSTSGTGAAGSIIITTTGNTATLSNGSRIASSSTGTMANAGDAGSITITDSGDFSSNGSTVATSAENAKGGDISISAQGVQLSNGTSITASSDAPFSADGAGDAGTIKITSTSTFVMQNSSVTTEASQASGGRITITAPEMIRLTNSQISTSVAGDVSDTTGGDISIDPNFVILQNSQILAQAFAGTGGDITITAGVFLADPSSLVDASSQLGISGSVDIRSPVSNVAGIVARLPESVLAAQELLRAACAARLAQAQASSFVEHGRDSIPVGPDGLLASPFLPPPPEPQQSGVSFFQPGSAGGALSIQTSGAHVRRLLGMDPTPRVQLLSGEAACGS